MNSKTQLIALTLTNIADTDSDVNLLSTPSNANNSLFDTYYKLSFSFASGFLFIYILDGVSYNYYLTSLSNIDEMILQLNNEFLGYAIFNYELNGFSPNYFLTIIVTNSNFTPYSLENLA